MSEMGHLYLLNASGVALFRLFALFSFETLDEWSYGRSGIIMGAVFVFRGKVGGLVLVARLAGDALVLEAHR